jgi:hypothetical protein
LDATTAKVASVEQKAGLECINVSTFMATSAAPRQSSSSSSGSQNSHDAHSSSNTLRGSSNGRTQRHGLIGLWYPLMPMYLSSMRIHRQFDAV